MHVCGRGGGKGRFQRDTRRAYRVGRIGEGRERFGREAGDEKGEQEARESCEDNEG